MDVIKSVLSSLHFESTTFLVQVVLFFVMHYSLKFLVYQPIIEIRERRDRKMNSSLALAEAATEEARSLKQDYEEKIRAARALGQSQLLSATESVEAERSRRVAAARADAELLLREAQATAQAAREKAESTIDAQSEEVAKAIASRLLESSIGRDDSRALITKIGGGS